jgi:hypothetical protein
MSNFITISTFLFKNSKKKFFFICNILGLAFACLIIFIYPVKFKSTVLINYPSQYNFLFQYQIKEFVQLENNHSLQTQYKMFFNTNFLSHKNLIDFINNNKKDNLLLPKFRDNIKLIKKLPFNIDDGEFFLVFDKKSVDAKELFIDYIHYTKKKTLENIFNEYKRLILLNIQNREQSLKDADFILNNKELSQNVHLQSQLFNKRFLIDKEIKELKKLYFEFKIEKFDYVVYTDPPSDPVNLYYSNYSIIFFGLMFGSALFLVIIFLNSNGKNKKKFL